MGQHRQAQYSQLKKSQLELTVFSTLERSQPSSGTLTSCNINPSTCKHTRKSKRERWVGGEREREGENSNSETLFDKDCSLGSVKNLTNNYNNQSSQLTGSRKEWAEFYGCIKQVSNDQSLQWQSLENLSLYLCLRETENSNSKTLQGLQFRFSQKPV